LLVMKIVQQIRSIQWFVLVMCQPKSRDMSDDVHDGCYPGSSTCGEDVDNTRGRGNDKGEDGRDTLVKDGRVGPRDIRNDATGHGKTGDGVLVSDDLADGSVAEGPRSYTFGPNTAPDRPRRYAFGQTADVHVLPDEGDGRRRCN